MYCSHFKTHLRLELSLGAVERRLESKVGTLVGLAAALFTLISSRLPSIDRCPPFSRPWLTGVRSQQERSRETSWMEKHNSLIAACGSCSVVISCLVKKEKRWRKGKGGQGRGRIVRGSGSRRVKRRRKSKGQLDSSCTYVYGHFTAHSMWLKNGHHPIVQLPSLQSLSQHFRWHTHTNPSLAAAFVQLHALWVG